MKYKIYRIEKQDETENGNSNSFIEDLEFKYDDFDTIDEAFIALKKRGDGYIQYTILPYISLYE
jgi:hypothetical protein